MRAHTYVHLLYFLSHQTAGCLRSRNQCLLDSLDWGPPLPSDSRVIIGPANTDEHSHVGIQEDTDSDYTNKQLQDRSLQWRRRYRPCSQYVLYAWVICLSFKHWVAYAYRYIGELTRTGGGDWDQGEQFLTAWPCTCCCLSQPIVWKDSYASYARGPCKGARAQTSFHSLAITRGFEEHSRHTCLLLWADISTCSRPTGLRGSQRHRKHSPSHTGPTWQSQLLQSPEC